MTTRIQNAIKELEAAIRADSHPWHVRFEMVVYPSYAEYGFKGATNGNGVDEYNLKQQRINEVQP